MDKSLVVFQDKNIRRTWFNEEWWFVVEDIVQVLTDSVDVKQYINKLRQRDEELSKGWVQFVHTLPIKTKGGFQSMNCSNTKGIFRLIQSISSKKAEPFKLWLAKVGYERIKEIENPEIAQKRMKELYKQKGYSDDWIEKRVRGIAIRDELTEEWKKRDIKKKIEFAILTAEISKETFGMTPKEYKEFKNLNNENLRDHMNDWELIFTMVGEKATIDIAKYKNTIGFEKNKIVAKKGGRIAKNTREELEKEIGKSTITNQNFNSYNKKKLK